MTLAGGAADLQRLAQQIRAECVRRGWDVGELACRAGVSRTTLYHLAHGHTDRPRASTLKRIAAALGIDTDTLVGRPTDPESPRYPVSSRNRVSDRARWDAAAAFDRATNTAVAEVMHDRPDLFAGWSADDVDELYSLFGVGGQLTPRGVACAAEAINAKRETIHKLHVVLDTHLRERAVDLIDLLYEMVQARGGTTPAVGVQPSGCVERPEARSERGIAPPTHAEA
jgi:transcriptional regulator with XRE-family HTH domain